MYSRYIHALYLSSWSTLVRLYGVKAFCVKRRRLVTSDSHDLLSCAVVLSSVRKVRELAHSVAAQQPVIVVGRFPSSSTRGASSQHVGLRPPSSPATSTRLDGAYRRLVVLLSRRNAARRLSSVVDVGLLRTSVGAALIAWAARAVDGYCRPCSTSWFLVGQRTPAELTAVAEVN